MARFQLAPGETLVGKGSMSLKQKWGLSSQLYQGTIYVTNRRIFQGFRLRNYRIGFCSLVFYVSNNIF